MYFQLLQILINGQFVCVISTNFITCFRVLSLAELNRYLSYQIYSLPSSYILNKLLTLTLQFKNNAKLSYYYVTHIKPKIFDIF